MPAITAILASLVRTSAVFVAKERHQKGETQAEVVGLTRLVTGAGVIAEREDGSTGGVTQHQPLPAGIGNGNPSPHTGMKKRRPGRHGGRIARRGRNGRVQARLPQRGVESGYESIVVHIQRAPPG